VTDLGTGSAAPPHMPASRRYLGAKEWLRSLRGRVRRVQHLPFSSASISMLGGKVAMSVPAFSQIAVRVAPGSTTCRIGLTLLVEIFHNS
jgi:hypothetical protein